MPREPVYLEMATPLPTKVLFCASKAEGKVGSKAAVTSADRHLEFWKQRMSSAPWALHSCCTKWNTYMLFRPVTPSEPISSLSVSTQTVV